MSMTIAKELPTYHSDLFIGRAETTEEIMTQVDSLVTHGKADKRVYVIQGQRGVGKSWLLDHLKNNLLKKFSDDIVLFKFNFHVFFHENKPHEEVVKELLTRFQQEIVPHITLTGITLTEMSRQIQTNLTLDKPLVVLLDTVYEMEWSLLKLVERYFLEMIVSYSNTMLIMAGRGRAYPWKALEIRLRSQKIDLPPFNSRETEQQLERQYPKATPYSTEIYELTRGDPMGNYLLGRPYERQPIEDRVEILDTVINLKLDIITNVNQKEIVRDCIEALSVLKSFDKSRLMRMLKQYRPEKYQAIDDKRVQEYLDLLLEYAFAQWDSTENSYQLDKGIQRFCRKYLKEKYQQDGISAPTWKNLQCEAYRLYGEWLTTYPRTQEIWRREQQYHAERLAKLNIKPEVEC